VVLIGESREKGQGSGLKEKKGMIANAIPVNPISPTHPLTNTSRLRFFIDWYGSGKG